MLIDGLLKIIIMKTKEIIKILEEEGETAVSWPFQVFGNPLSKNVILVEKLHIVKKIIEEFNDLTQYFIIYGHGLPSKNCLKYIEQMPKNRQFFYLGDLDPCSILTYLIYSFNKTYFSIKDKPMTKIKFLGIKSKDNFPTNCMIKLKNPELKTLKYVSEYADNFNIKEIKEEIKFLQKNRRKIEVECISITIGLKKYLENKFNNFYIP